MLCDKLSERPVTDPTIGQPGSISAGTASAHFVKAREWGGEEVTTVLLTKAPDVTAIFYASDLMAIGGMRRLLRMGKRVPHDVAVVGYDNIDLGEWVVPALTTVAQRRYDMGKASVDMLMGMLRRQERPRACLLTSEMVVRQST